MKLLIVDDESPARERLRRLLAELDDCEVVGEADNGEQALASCGELRPDVVLLDVRMPGLSGPEVAARLRAESGPNMDIPILAFTADVDLADLGEASNFDGVVHKPISPRDMVATIVQHLTWLRVGDRSEGAAVG